MPGWRERLRLHRLELTVGHQAYKFAAAAPPLLLTSCVLWFVSCHPRTVFCFFGERQCCFANESVVLRTKVCPFLRQQEWARCEHRRAPPRAWRTHRFLQMHVDRAGYLPSSSRVSSRAPLSFFLSLLSSSRWLLEAVMPRPVMPRRSVKPKGPCSRGEPLFILQTLASVFCRLSRLPFLLPWPLWWWCCCCCRVVVA